MGYNYKEIKFGIEVEFTGLSRRDAIQVVANYFNFEAEYLGGAYDRYITYDNQLRRWRIERDSTVIPQRRNVRGKKVQSSENFKCELVSPILLYEDIPQLQELIRTLRRAGAFVNKRCSIHIHVDGNIFKENPSALRHFCKIIFSKQFLLNKAIKVYSDRKSYCKDIEKDIIDRIDREKPETLRQFGRTWFNSNTYAVTNRYNSRRYILLNPTPLLSNNQSKDTIELRIFNSTLHAGIVKSFIQYVLLVAERSLTVKRASSKVTIPLNGNEKWAMRQHLLKIGCKGEEFKSLRYHLLKNLEGDVAFKDMRRLKKK